MVKMVEQHEAEIKELKFQLKAEKAKHEHTLLGFSTKRNEFFVDWSKAPEGAKAFLMYNGLGSSPATPYFWKNENGKLFINGHWYLPTRINLEDYKTFPR